MNRRKKLAFNTIAALIYQAVTLVCGFVLPKFVIPYFGSETNGLINSITQVLTIITLCEMGVGAVVQSALYKPLADKDDVAVSKIIKSSNRFFNRIMMILGVYIIGLIIVYPLVIDKKFDFLYTAGLIVVIAASYIAQYYLLLSYRLLLNADQASYVQLGAHTIALILNTIITIVLIKIGAGVHIVKLGSAISFFVQPIIIKLYVHKHYNINTKIELTDEPIKQKWNGMAQHVAVVVHQNTPTVVLTLFGNLKDVSVYGVYYLITHGIRQIVSSLTTGIQAMLGNMYANGEEDSLKKSFATVEFAFHTITTLIFTITGILLIPFISIYAANFTDAEYIIPIFGVLMTLGQAAYCLKHPYDMMMRVAGHYKQTQTSSFIEAGICIAVSCALVWKFGVLSVALGTLASTLYRTVYLSLYISKNIIKRNAIVFAKHIAIDIVSVLIMVVSTFWIKLGAVNYFSWVLMALQVGFICLAVSVAINFLFYRKELLSSLRLLGRKIKK